MEFCCLDTHTGRTPAHVLDPRSKIIASREQLASRDLCRAHGRLLLKVYEA